MCPRRKGPTKGGLDKVTSFDHMNEKVGALYQNINNLSITLDAIVDDITLNFQIYEVADHIGATCQMMDEPIPDQMNYA